MLVRHSAGSYAVRFCTLEEAFRAVPRSAVVITDVNVHSIYGAAIPHLRGTLVVAPGERSKSIGAWSDLLSRLARLGADRATTIVAFGGGVVGDLAGFVAASYMRGVPFIQIPTSLMAQVDSSVGGKVGLDMAEGKNLVGAFYAPGAVYVCIEALVTLPARELVNGMAEVWKYAFILDGGLCDAIRGDGISLNVIERCVQLKADVVSADEFESTGERAKLNFGHTVGHAIEKLTGYGPVLHGEAISIGMVAEARLGERLGVTEPGTADFVEKSLRAEGLPTTSVVLKDADALIHAMRRDKKATSGKLAFSLLEAVGRCRLVRDIPEAEVRAVLAQE